MSITAESLQVELSSSGGTSVRRSLSRVKEAAQAVERTVARMGDQVEESGDAFTGMGAQAATAAGGVSALRVSMFGLSGSLTAVVPAVTAVTVAIGTLATTLAPLVITLGGIATALTGVVAGFGAVIGSGILAFGNKLAENNKAQLQTIKSKISGLESLKQAQGELSDEQARRLKQLKEEKAALEDKTTATAALGARLKELKNSIAQAIIPLGKQFIPLIKDALDAIPRLVRNIVAVTGPLDSFKNALRDLGNAAFRVLPDIVASLLEIGRTALPVLRDLAEQARSGAASAFERLSRVFNRVYPVVRDFAAALSRLLGPITKIGTAILVTLLPPLTDLINFITANAPAAFAAFKDVVDDLRPAFTSLINTVTEFLPSFREIVTFIQENGPQAFRKLRDVFTELKPKIVDLITQVRDFLPTFKEVVEFIRTDGQQAFTDLKTAFTELKPDLVELFNAIEDFLPTLVRFGQFVAREVVPPLTVLAFLAADTLIPVVTKVVKLVDRAFEAFNRLPQPIKDATGKVIALVAAGAAVFSVLTTVASIVGTVIGVLSTVAGVIGTVISVAGTLYTAFATAVAIVTAFIGVAANVISVLVSVGGIITTVVSVAGTLFSAFTTIVSVVATVVSAIGTLIAVLNPVTLIIGAVVAAAIGLYAAWKTNFLGIRDITNQVITTVKAVLSDLVTRGKALFTDFVTQATTLWTRLKTRVVQLVTTLKDRAVALFTTAKDRVVTLVTTLKDRAVALWTQLKDRTIALVTTLKDRAVALATTLKDKYIQFWTTIFNRVVELATNLKDRAIALVTTLKDRLVSLVITLKDKYIQFWTTIFNRVVELATNLKDRAIALITTLKDRLVSLVITLKDRYIQFWTTIYNRVVELATNLKDRVLSLFGTLQQNLRTIIATIKSNIIDPILNAKNEIVGEGGNGGVIGTLVDAIASMLDFTPDISGITGQFDSIISEAKDAWDWIQKVTGADVDAGGSSGGDSGGNSGGSSGTGSTEDSFDVDTGDPTDFETDTEDWVGEDQGTGPVNETEGGGTIPGFDRGGIVNAGSGMLARLHGREAITPLDELPGIMAEAMPEGAGGDTTVVSMDVTIENPDDGDDVIKTLEREAATIFEQ